MSKIIVQTLENLSGTVSKSVDDLIDVNGNVGDATATTQASSDNSDKIATTSFVKTAVSNKAASGANTDITSLNGPALGAATATTPAVNDNSTKVATTAYYVGQSGTATPQPTGTATVGTSLKFAREDHSHASDSVGVGQSWSDVTASRSSGMVYINTTGKPIAVTISGAWGAEGKIYVDSSSSPTAIGATSLFGGGSTLGHIHTIVPNGHYYKLESSGLATLTRWIELR